MIVYPKALKVYIPGVETIHVSPDTDITFKIDNGALCSYRGDVKMTVHRFQEGEMMYVGMALDVDKTQPGIVFCDRCKEKVGPDSIAGCASGFYRNWFGKKEDVCDHCMWHSKEYRAIYGKMPCSCKKCKCDCTP